MQFVSKFALEFTNFFKGKKMKKILVLMTILGYLQAGELEFTTLESDFTQSVTSKTKQISYSGHFVANSKRGAFWHYKKPVEKFIYFNYGRVTMIEPELEQATMSDLKDSPNITQILANAEKTGADKYQANFDGIEYTIRVRKSVPVQINYTDKLENKVIVTLKNTRKNEPINEQLLEPNIPENYDILNN